MSRFLFIACACVVAYVMLHVLRSLGVDPEARGLWAGGTGWMMGDLVTAHVARRTRGRKARR